MTTTQNETTPNLVLFARGVIAVLASWSVLRLAVAEQWGGPESAPKRTWIASEIVDAFEARGAQLDQDDVEEMILQALADEFECNVEDGSSTTVARDIIKLWKDIGEGNMEFLEETEAIAKAVSGKKVQARVGEGNGDSDWEDDVDSDEIEEEDAPQLVDRSEKRAATPPEVDEEGFTTVRRGGRSHT